MAKSAVGSGDRVFARGSQLEDCGITLPERDLTSQRHFSQVYLSAIGDN
jgi:hypothetical protein